MHACTDQLRQAIQIPNPIERRSALRQYYFPIPTPSYQYPFFVFNCVVATFWGVRIGIDLYTQPGLLPYLPLVLAGALYVGDFISAMFHKWLDSYASEVNPIWGSPARAFRVHHEFPNNLNEVGFVHNITSMSWFMAMLYGLTLICAYALEFGPLLSLFLWVQLLLFLIGNEIHRQAHAPRPWAWMGWLQRRGILLTAERHRRHHVGERNSDFGIVNGWANPLINWLDLPNRMDVWLWRAFRLFPRNWIQKPHSIPPAVAVHLAQHPREIPEELQVYQSLFGQELHNIDVV